MFLFRIYKMKHPPRRLVLCTLPYGHVNKTKSGQVEKAEGETTVTTKRKKEVA